MSIFDGVLKRSGQGLEGVFNPVSGLPGGLKALMCKALM